MICKPHGMMNDDGKCPWCRIAELEAENKTLRGDLEITELRLTAAWNESDELREAVRDAVDDDFMTSKYMIRLACLVRQRT